MVVTWGVNQKRSVLFLTCFKKGLMTRCYRETQLNGPIHEAWGIADRRLLVYSDQTLKRQGKDFRGDTEMRLLPKQKRESLSSWSCLARKVRIVQVEAGACPRVPRGGAAGETAASRAGVRVRSESWRSCLFSLF